MDISQLPVIALIGATLALAPQPASPLPTPLPPPTRTPQPVVTPAPTATTQPAIRYLPVIYGTGDR